MITAIREHAVVRNGMIQMPEMDLPDGTEVEVIVLVSEEQDATDFLLSTEANREHLEKALEDAKDRPSAFMSMRQIYEKHCVSAGRFRTLQLLDPLRPKDRQTHWRFDKGH